MTSERSSVDLLEEAVALVRRAPGRAWTWYLAGAVPFFGAVLFYLRSTTGVLAVPDLSLPALSLAVLFGWRQFSRSMFGRILAHGLAGNPPEHLSRNWPRAAVRTWFAGLCRVVLFLPVPWVSALFRNYQAYAWEEAAPLSRAAAMAARGGDVVVGWLLLGLMSLFVWINVFSGMLIGPTLYQIFTGQETVLTRNPAALLNRTVWMASLIIAWCLCDVVMEALYALRRFYGDAEKSGIDLLRSWRTILSRAAAGLVLLIAAASGIQAQTPPGLNESIDRVLSQPQYQWREAPTQQVRNEPVLIRWLRSLKEGIARRIRAILRPLRQWLDRFLRWISGSNSAPPEHGPAPPVNALRVAAVVGIVLLAGALVVLLLRSRSRKGDVQPCAAAATPVPVDLSDPALIATDLPEAEWLALARDWMEKGDARMALRAWFLACLAFLNARELVSISRYKSNLDYRRELARRSRGNPGLDREFATGVAGFENAWYGSYPAGADEVERLSASYERMRELCR